MGSDQRLFLVRHGPTHATGMIGWTDLPADLSDRAALGRLDAALPGGAALVTSDLGRAIATADALPTPRRRLPADAAFREIHFGAWEARSHADVSAETPALARAFWETPGDIAPPGGESWNALTARVGAGLSRLPAGDVVVVCHFGAILALLQLTLGLTPVMALGHQIAPLSLTRIDHSAGTWAARTINHLP